MGELGYWMRSQRLQQPNRRYVLGDCERMGLRIAETLNGETIALHLAEISARSGTPVAIIKDCEATLQKGLRLWMEKGSIRISQVHQV